MNSIDEAFSSVKQYCRKEGRISEAAMKLWIDIMKPVQLDGSVAVFTVQSEFQKTVVMNTYNALLKEAFLNVLGLDVKIQINVVTPEENDNPLSENSNAKDYDELARRHEELEHSFEGANYEYTFATFIVGGSNEFAYAACTAVAKEPGKNYNPLFIYGDSGLGKTHLLYAIAHQVRQRQPEARIVYIKGDDFTNELIASIREGKNAEFREKYRQSTLLLVDDIQFIAGKKQTQEEFFHTFNTLYESGRQIVLTSDRPPREMTQLEDRLQTRFEWGLMVDVAPPDFETRLAIIKNKAALLGVQLPDDISSFIAENLTANVRQIEGALNKLLAYRDLLGNQVDGEAVSRAVKDMLKKYNEFVPSPSLIIEYICRYYDVDEEQVRGQGRKRDLMEARQTAMYLIRRMTNLSLNDIGKEFGDRDHTTVLHSLDQVEKKMRSDPAYAEKVKEITTNINNKK